MGNPAVLKHQVTTLLIAGRLRLKNGQMRKKGPFSARFCWFPDSLSVFSALFLRELLKLNY